MILVSDRDVLRFVSKIKSMDTPDCWEWRGTKDRYGYGVFQIKNKQAKAHRFSYFVLKLHRMEIPLASSVKYDSVSHLCDNNSCVNPSHLVIEPIKNNKRRSTDKIVVCPNGHDLNSNLVFWDYAHRNHRTCTTCKKEKMALAYELAAQAAIKLDMGVTNYINAFGKSTKKSLEILKGTENVIFTRSNQ